MSDVGLVSSMAVVQGDGRSLEKADIHELRAYVLFLFKQVVTSRKEETVMEEDELRRVIVYINSIMQDDDQLVDFVPLVVALLTEQPSSVTELFLDLDGLKVMVSMLASKNELVRIYFLKLVHKRTHNQSPPFCLVPDLCALSSQRCTDGWAPTGDGSSRTSRPAGTC